jgi:hypothetical protein
MAMSEELLTVSTAVSESLLKAPGTPRVSEAVYAPFTPLADESMAVVPPVSFSL